jgi:hypothetical protein
METGVWKLETGKKKQVKLSNYQTFKLSNSFFGHSVTRHLNTYDKIAYIVTCLREGPLFDKVPAQERR